MFSCILKLNAILFRPLIIIYVFECYTYNVITDDYVTIRKNKTLLSTAVYSLPRYKPLF